MAIYYYSHCCIFVGGYIDGGEYAVAVDYIIRFQWLLCDVTLKVSCISPPYSRRKKSLGNGAHPACPCLGISKYQSDCSKQHVTNQARKECNLYAYIRTTGEATECWGATFSLVRTIPNIITTVAMYNYLCTTPDVIATMRAHRTVTALQRTHFCTFHSDVHNSPDPISRVQKGQTVSII